MSERGYLSHLNIEQLRQRAERLDFGLSNPRKAKDASEELSDIEKEIREREQAIAMRAYYGD